MNAVCLDEDYGLMSSVVSYTVVQDHDEIVLTVIYSSKRETLPISSVCTYYTQYLEPVDAQRFRSGLRLDGKAFEIPICDNIRLIGAGGRLVRRVHWGGRGSVACRYPRPGRIRHLFRYTRKLTMSVGCRPLLVATFDSWNKSLIVLKILLLKSA